MESISNLQVFFSSFIGELIYFGALILTVVISFVISVKQNFRNQNLRIIRSSFLLILLLICLLFSISIVGRIGFVDIHGYLPPLERSVNVAIVSILCCLLLNIQFTNPRRIGWIFFSIILVCCLISYWIWWAGPSNIFYNQTWMEIVWTLTTIFIAIYFLINLFSIQTRTRVYRLFFIVAIIIGFILHFFENGFSSDIPAIPRLTILIVFCPVAIGIYYINGLDNVMKSKKNSTLIPPLPSIKNIKTPLEELSDAWIDFQTEKTGKLKITALTRIIAYTLNSQVGYQIELDSNSRIISFVSGFNVINKSNLETFTMNSEELPLVWNALVNWEVFHISKQNSISSDIENLRKNISQEMGGMLVIPFMGQELIKKTGFLLLYPFNQEVPSLIAKLKDSNLLNALRKIIGELTDSQKNDENQDDQRLIDVLNRLQEVQIENALLLEEISSYKNNQQYKYFPNDSKQIHRDLPISSDGLQGEDYNNNSFSKKPVTQIEMELRLTLEELARLQNVVAESNIKIHQLKSQIENPPNIDAENFQLIDSIVQELRQPITSIIGYINLMQSESAGSLNSIQKKYISRVHASIERLLALLDDLINISKIQLDLLDINLEKINLVDIVDQSLRSVIGQIREKNITLRLDVPKKLPLIEADKQSILLIINRLLLNACMLSPENQFIVLKVKNESHPQKPNEGFIRIQVTDSGGGIPPEELGNVFSSQFQASKPLLKGVGDTGIGLVITKWLVEAHHGNIWVESDYGRTTTINILIPIRNPKNYLQ